MKIYKPTIESFLKEATGTVYMQEHESTKNGARRVHLSLTAFNDAGQVVEYTIEVGTFLYNDVKAASLVYNQADQYKEQIKSRVEVQPGYIHDKTIRAKEAHFPIH